MSNPKRVVLSEITATIPVRIVPIYDIYSAFQGESIVLCRDAGETKWTRRRITSDVTAQDLISDEVRFGIHVLTIGIDNDPYEVYVPHRAFDHLGDYVKTLIDQGGLHPEEDE